MFPQVQEESTPPRQKHCFRQKSMLKNWNRLTHITLLKKKYLLLKNQGFPNTIVDGKFCSENFFYQVVGIWGWVHLTIQIFLKGKNNILCEYWTWINIKISMICVYKEYEVKIKMEQEQWLQLKIKFSWKLLFSWQELTFGLSPFS